MKLSENFSLEELTRSEVAARNGWDNTPNDLELANLARLADLLEDVKDLVDGKPVIINSAFRCKKVNDAVGSKDTSQHLLGCAADIRVLGMTPAEVMKTIVRSHLKYDQVILEFDSWVHISVPNPGKEPRGSELIIDRRGTRPYI